MFKKIPFRITVLSLFLMLSMLIIVFMIYIQSIYGKEFSQKIMHDNFNLISTKIKDNLKTLDITNTFFINTVTSSFLDLKNFEEIANNKELYLKVLVNFLQNNDDVYSSYFAFDDDSFFQVINLNIEKSLKTQYSLSDDSRWLLIFINGKNKTQKTLYSYDNNLKLIAQIEKENDYFATTRPWYINAKNAKNELIKSKPYTFKNINSTGMTFVKNFNENATFAIDVLLNNLNTTINDTSSLKTMNSFLFAQDKELISTTTNNQILISYIKNLLDDAKISENKELIYKINNVQYIVNFSNLDDKIYKYLITIVTLDDVMMPYSKYFNLIISFTTLLFLILLPLIWYFASIIVRPILQLKLESIKVKKRDYKKLKMVNSRVFEIQELSNAILDMGDSIHEYQNNLEQKVMERTKELESKNIELERLSITDKLTNIYNRIKLDKTILEQLNLAKRYKVEFGIMIIDVDYFKKVNDTYGHQVGDTTLIEVANILKTNIRESDTVGRWGGEEFVIICPHTNLEGIKIVANIIREKIEKHQFPVVGNKTASFGITIYQDNDNLESIISRADEALYNAKNNGRNRVEFV
jgi:diguanylate cyclase (GGDEF)-like protein